MLAIFPINFDHALLSDSFLNCLIFVFCHHRKNLFFHKIDDFFGRGLFFFVLHHFKRLVIEFSGEQFRV